MISNTSESCRLCGTSIRPKQTRKNDSLCKACAQFGAPHPDFASHCSRAFGRHNPEPMSYPFWLHMVATGHTAYEAEQRHGRGNFHCRGPIWTFDRFGMSCTSLPDGRTLFIAGEHEDYYDPHFCIYNDLIIRKPDGSYDIYGYPRSVFPPTDFHTATLVGDQLYIIGSVGYLGERVSDHTPVHRLDTTTLAIDALTTSGAIPGWIANHVAKWSPGSQVIVVYGGQRYAEVDGAPVFAAFDGLYALDLATYIWQRLDD